MNRKQRDKNRSNAKQLARSVRQKALMQHTCGNCGEKGGHWISTRSLSLEAMLTGHDDREGFWTCPMLYGPDGRRLPEHTDSDGIAGLTMLAIAGLLPNAELKGARARA